MLEWLDISRYLGLPENAAAHGAQIDYMMGLVHWLMLILFLIWAPFFIYVLVRFRATKHPRASYRGLRGHFSTYQEVGVIVAELALIFGFAVPMWGHLRADNSYPDEAEATVVHVVAEQFAWNVHYPGPDGVFGARDVNLIDVQLNPIGLDRDDPNAADDVVLTNELHLPVDRPAIIYLSSKDVIHSFALNTMRIKMDVIPGLVIPVWFVPTQTGEWEIGCAQLCGVGHYRMRGFITVHSQEDFDAFLAERAGP
jgi:cytochrome c oxidase subunit II